MLEVTAIRIGSRVQRMRGEAKVDGQLVADADIMSIIADRSLPIVHFQFPIPRELRQSVITNPQSEITTHQSF